MTISHLLDVLIHSTYYRDQVAWIERLPERAAQYAEPKQPLHPTLKSILEALDIRQLYTHQTMALDAVRAGGHVVIVTSTASTSGKPRTASSACCRSSSFTGQAGVVNCTWNETRLSWTLSS